MSQKELVSLAKSGDVEAFSKLYGIYKEKLYAYAYYRLGNESDAEDAVQDCVLTAFEEIGALRSADAFSAWIFRILYCSCTTKIKEQIIRRSTDDIESFIDISSEESENFIQQQELRQALAKLSDEDREIVLLSVSGGFKSKEISKITGLSAGAVRQRLSRSLSKMKKELM